MFQKTRLIFLKLAQKRYPVHLTTTDPAAKLQDDLRRYGIEPYAWIANQSMSAANVTDSLLKQRAAEEVLLLKKINEEHASRLYSIPWNSRGANTGKTDSNSK